MLVQKKVQPSFLHRISLSFSTALIFHRLSEAFDKLRNFEKAQDYTRKTSGMHQSKIAVLRESHFISIFRKQDNSS